MSREWRLIPSFPRYIASAAGEIAWSCTGEGEELQPKSILKQFRSGKSGYWTVSVNVDGAFKNRRVNRLVCEAFHGLPPTESHHAAHNNGKHLDNRASSLRWATALENVQDKFIHGTVSGGRMAWNDHRRLRGEKHGRAKLTPEQVRSIRQDRRGQDKIAAELGVAQTTISAIKRRIIWRHIP